MNVSKRVLLVTSAAPSQTPFSTWEKKPPLGVGFLLSMLRNAGHDVFFIDNYLEPSDFLESGYLQATGIDYIGIYVSTICFRDTQRMLYKIEHLRRCGQWYGKIILGGPHTTVALDTIPAFVDHVVQGEGEQAIVDIVEGKVNDRVVRYPRIRDLDALPMPAWDLFTKLPYNWDVLWFPEKPTFTMTTSRGCPFRCAFCSVGAVWGKQYTCFSAARIVSDIEHLIEHYGAKGIYFREDNFTLDRKRVVEFCKLLLERHIDIRWACESRVDNLDRELLELMHKAGARGFYFGVESGSQRILDELHKGITVDQIRTSFRLCNEIGFKTAASIVVGLPQETEEDLAATDALLSEINPTMTWHNVFVGIPSSKLYRYVIDRNLYEFIDDRGLVYLKGHNDRVRTYYQNSWDADIPFHPESPAISVIMAAHNAAAFLKEAIHSILKQTYPNFELLVVDDASSDETAAILSRYDDPRIKIIKNTENLGPAGSRNKALAAARGTYIAIMDADDISLPHRLETQLRFLESHPDYALVGSYAYQIDEAGHHESIIELQTEDDTIRRCLISGNNFVHGSVMARREVLLRAGGYSESFKYAHDYELWLRLIESCKVANLPEPLYCWRSSSTQISTAKRAEQDSFAERARREAAERADAESRHTGSVCSEARSLAMEGYLDEALEIFNRRIEGRPNDALAHFCLGQLHERREERPSARACYEKAVSLEPANIPYLKHLAGFLLVEEGDTGKALAIYDRVLHLAPRDSETLLIRGNIAASSRQYDNAERFYRMVLDLDPGNVNAIENLETLSKLKQKDIRDTARAGTTFVRKTQAQKTLETFKVTAIISAHNEGDVIYHVIGDLIHQGISVYLLDHLSTDNTVSEASNWLGKGLLHIETFPDDSHYAEENKSQYIWRDILKRKTALATQLDADWFIHADADEFRESPWPGLTLREAFYVVDRLGYNAIDFELLNFRPIDNSFEPGTDVREFLKHYEGYEDYNTRQVKAWKNLRLPIDLVTSGGHDIGFEGRKVFPVRFIHRHYPIRSQQHGLQKVFQQRKNRFCDKERSMAWHIQYDHILDESHNFLHDPAQLTCYNGEHVRTRLLTDSSRHENTEKDNSRTLEKLVATGYDTDKSPRYLGNYERYFLPFTNDPVRLLELGVFRGGSLYLWRDFFKNGFIVGLDANAASIDDSTGRIRIYQGLQQDKDLLDRIRRECAPDGFDVILDDASHVGELTRISFWHLFENHLKPGGLYVIEDWGTGYWDSFPDGKSYTPGENHVAGMVGFVKELIDECGMRDITHPMHGRNPQRESRIDRMEVCSGQVFIVKKASPTAPCRTQTEAVPHPQGEPAAGALPIKRQRRESDQDARYHRNMATLYYGMGDRDEARNHFEKAVSLEPENAAFRKNLADYCYVVMKRTEEAVRHYEKALFLNPRDTETLLILGNIRAESGDLSQARDCYLRVLEIDPSNDLAGKMFDALETKAEESGKRDPESLVREARCLARRGRTDRAVHLLETLLSACADHAAAHDDLGNLYCLLQKPDKALFHLERAVHLAPEKIEYLRDLADAHLAEAGDLERALGLYNKALALKPDDIETLLRIGNICAAQKQFDPARFFYGRVLSIEPGNAQAEENLSVLQRMVEEKPSPAEPAPVCQGTERPIGEGGRAEGCTLPSQATHRCASIIIPVFNQVEFTSRCLEALYQNTPLDEIHEVLIVDNGSSDGTGKILEGAMRQYPKLKVLTNAENLLFAKACNQGADVAGGDYLVFLNNDTEPLSGWLDHALERIESDDSIGILGIKLLYPDRTVQHCGIQFQRNAHPSYVVWPLHRHLRASADEPRVNVPQDVHAVTGACLIIRRDLFRRIGGFEERYGMYFEDTDLCFKARRAGKRVFYEPASVVIHHEGISSTSREVIDDLNARAARLFFKTWKEDLYGIELETLIEKEDGKYAYLPDHFWPDEVSPEEIVRMHHLISSFPSCQVHFGGSGDALLLLSTFYDRDPEQTIVSVSNSTGMMRSFFDAFPKLKKVYFIPFPKNYTWHYIARRFFKSSDICLGLGATPTTTADYKEWNADLDIFKAYGIQQRPAWAVNFGKNRLAPRQVTLQPRGSLKGMVGSKRNALSTRDWARLLSHLEKKGARPIIIGTPDEAAEYPCLGNAVDKRSYSFSKQMQLISASDFFIGADSWGKTFSALAGIHTFVFHAQRGDDLKDWKDASDHVFLDPWDEITIVKDFKEFRESFDDAWRDECPSVTDLKIRWEGSQFVHHSLALVNRELCLRLIEGGCEVSIVPYERDQFTPKDEPRFKPIAERTRKPLSGPADVHVRHQWPPNFTPPPEGHWVIIQPWEFGSIPREWVHNMSARVDEVWVPSHYVRDCYIKSGVPSERVFVVPNGVDIGLFNPDNAPYPLKTKKAFKFLFVGGTIQRKGIDILLDVYTKTFSSGDDVCLVIKDMGGQTFYKGQTAKDWIGRFQADPGSPEIEYIEHTLSDREIAGLYTACDCLAHPYRGEGFGLPIAEAMASGLPVIVTGHGAALDFCDDQIAYLILAKEMRLLEKRIGEFDTVDFPWLAEPDKEGLARLMRHAATHREEAAAKGSLAAEFIRANFTWDHAAEAVKKRVRELRGKPIVRLQRHENSTRRKDGIHQELLSIIIPVSKEAPNLRNCLDSIRKWTPEPHEMVFVESEAASGAKKWLKKISQKDPLCRVVQTDGQPPVSDPVRLGLRSCAGKYVAVVEPDIVVTEHWCAGMLEALESSADIGIVGPMMVNTEGRQNVPGTEGLSASNLEHHAAAFQKQNRHRRVFCDHLSRSCMMFKRNLADEIGLTHNGPQREECDPDEWCLRSIYSGYQNLIAGDVLVYRSGNGDGNGQGIPCGAAGERKPRTFAAKASCLNAGTPEDKRFLAMLAFREATERFQQGDLRGATETCLEAIKLAPWKRGFYLALAEMLIQTKHFREALDLLKESDPGEQDVRTVSLVGCILEGLGEDEEAGRKADLALAMSAQSAQALNLKGVLAFKRGEIEHAKSFFKKATDADPSWGEPCTNLGVLTWAEHQHAEAFELLERGFVLTPCQSDLAERYHAAAVSLGAVARAEVVFREARGLYPSNRTIAFLRIDLLMAQENALSAMEEIEAAMAAFDVDDGFIAAALEVRNKIGPLEIKRKTKEETLSLCMIVKNEERNLIRCLSSVKAPVDEIIVVDTGSTDRTKELAAAFGAKVFDAPWTDDFAEARNTALSKATGGWILVLDADETVSPADGLKLKDLMKHAASRKDTAGWLVTTRNYSPDMNLEGWTPNDGSYGSEEAASGWFPSLKVRLFRNDARIRYEGAVHEMVEPSMKKAGLAWRSCDVIVHHYGCVNGGGGPSKGESYYQLGKKKIEQTGGDPRSVYELAVQASRLKKYGEAVALWHRYLASGCGENCPLAFLNLGHALIETGRYAEAREASMAALSIDPGLKEAGLNTALCEFYTGRYKEAVSRLEGLVAAASDYPPAFVLLSAARLLSGENGSAEEMVQTLRKRNINGAPFYQVYGKKLREAGRNEDAETILEAARKSWSAMLASLGIPTTAENIGALMAAVPLDGAGERGAPPEKANQSTRSGSGRPCLSLCMIVKNEERTIARALESVKTLADEMIVVDTGSTDRTKEIAAALGAKVFDFPWMDDFSSARNYSLTRATGDWILVIDADETVSSRDHETIRDLILKSPAATGGYDLTTRNYVVEATTAGWVANDGSYRDEEAGTGWYPNRKVRLFRNDPRIRFSGAVHELVEQSMLEAGLTIGACDVPVHHTGKLDRESVLEKGKRYYRLGLKKIEESGGTPRAILELATQAGELGRYDDAIRLWRRFLDGKPVQDVKQATINLIHSCLNADRFDEALLEARKAAGQANGTRELLLNCAAAEFFTGDLRKATRMAEKILKKEPDYPPALTLLAAGHALAGHAGKSTECLQRLHEKGLQLRSQILPVIEKLRKAGKKDEAARLMSLLDWQPQAACGPTPPSSDRSRQEGSRQARRGI